jgi:hypothetical protein
MTGYEQSPDYGGPEPTWTMRLGTPLFILVIVAALFVAYRSSAKGQTITPEQYHALTGRPCACPDDVMSNGEKCRTKSAYCRCGGFEPVCYSGDDNKEQRHANRLHVCGHGWD